MVPLPHTKCVRTYKKLGCFGASSKPLDELLITDRDGRSPKNDGHRLNWKEWEESIHRFEVLTVLLFDRFILLLLIIDLGPIHTFGNTNSLMSSLLSVSATMQDFRIRFPCKAEIFESGVLICLYFLIKTVKNESMAFLYTMSPLLLFVYTM